MRTGAVVPFAFGTVAPRGLPPLTATAWQVDLACLPMLAVGMLLKAPEPGALSPAAGRAMAYTDAARSWAAPLAVASMATPADTLRSASWRSWSPWVSCTGCRRHWC